MISALRDRKAQWHKWSLRALSESYYAAMRSLKVKYGSGTCWDDYRKKMRGVENGANIL